MGCLTARQAHFRKEGRKHDQSMGRNGYRSGAQGESGRFPAAGKNRLRPHRLRGVRRHGRQRRRQ